MNTASRVVHSGLTVLLVESELVGGECSYWACVPSKALLRASETIESAQAISGARQRLELLIHKYGLLDTPKVDLKGMWERRDMFAQGWKDDQQVKNMQDLGVHVVHGFGRIGGIKMVEIRDLHSTQVVNVNARHAVVVAMGSAPIVPEIAGLNDGIYWTSRKGVSAKDVPEHLIVLDAGAVGTEMATLYNEIGSRVALLCKRVLPKMVPEAGRIGQESLEKAGVFIHTGITATQVTRTGKTVKVTLSDGLVVEGTELLLATGRKARTAGMLLEKVGGPAEGAPIEVDNSMNIRSVSGRWMYAVGDTNGRAIMTHIARYQAKIAGNSILAMSKGTFETEKDAEHWDKLTVKPEGLAIAQSVFTDPQVAACGLTPEQARAKGITTRVVSVKMSGPGFGFHADGYDGWAQWVIDDTDRLVGATFVGWDAIDLLQASTMAIVGKMTLDQIWHVTPPFPSMSEIYTTLSEAAEI